MTPAPRRCDVGAFRLRPAAPGDADLLFAWRNDGATVAASLTDRAVGRREHEAWLANVLADPSRRLWIGEAAGLPVGTARADRFEAGWQLSWTIGPAHRRRGFGLALVRSAVALLDPPVSARIKTANGPSQRIAEDAGFQRLHDLDDVQLWIRW